MLLFCLSKYQNTSPLSRANGFLWAVLGIWPAQDLFLLQGGTSMQAAVFCKIRSCALGQTLTFHSQRQPTSGQELCSAFSLQHAGVSLLSIKQVTLLSSRALKQSLAWMMATWRPGFCSICVGVESRTTIWEKQARLVKPLCPRMRIFWWKIGKWQPSVAVSEVQFAQCFE